MSNQNSALSLILVAGLVACDTPPAPLVVPGATTGYTMTITEADGIVHELHVSPEEHDAMLARPHLPPLDDLFTAPRTEVILATGEQLVITRAPSGELVAGPVAVAFSDDTLFVTVAGGPPTTVELAGFPDEGYAALLALEILGAHVGFDGEHTPSGITRRDPIVLLALIGVGGAVVGYVTCVTAGNALCGDTARKTCRRGVDAFTAICGAGHDVDGKFQLGFQCSFRCQAR